jgi:uncharacterized protein YndB with AHSA1/START domain
VYSNIKVGLRPVIRHMLYVVAVLLLTGATLVVLAWLPAPVEPVRIHNALEIARSPDTVFDFTTTPSTWPKWHPATISVEGVTYRTPKVGEQVTEDYRSGGVLNRTRWTVVEHDSPRRWRIEGRGKFGEQASITYTFVPTPTGTRFERELRYRMPNRLGASLGLLIRRRVADESGLALRQLKSVLEA